MSHDRSVVRRWTPDRWCGAQFAALVLVFASAVVLIALRLAVLAQR
jgi:hypothetical protein